MNEIEKIIQESTQVKGIIRKLDELGRIVIPNDYRQGKVVDGKTKVAIYNVRDYVIVEMLEDMDETDTKIDEIGRVTISKKIRDELKWKENDSIETWGFGKYFILRK